MQDEPSFFDFAAEVGLTKHIGGVAATEELAALCHIAEGSHVLDVGCGAGITPCFLAKRYGCRVVGVDILEAMVERSTARARREGLSDRVTFRVADAQDLPFADGLFDAVITESVTTFPQDKPRAVREYARVARPGGYVGLNESTWLRYPPPTEMVAWVAQDSGAHAKPLTEGEWAGLLEAAGLEEVARKTYPVDLRRESQGMLRRYGCLGALDVMGRMLSLYLCNPAYRRFVRQVRQGGLTPPGLEQYLAYGLFVGRKPVG